MAKDPSSWDVRAVYVFPNGQVGVCDRFGRQIPELQGKIIPELRLRICERMAPNAEWLEMGNDNNHPSRGRIE
jgi:hypothetical protein